MPRRRPRWVSAGADPPRAAWQVIGRAGELGARLTQGSVALSLCTTAHPLHPRFTNIFGDAMSEATMRPNPRLTPLDELLARADIVTMHVPHTAATRGMMAAAQVPPPACLMVRRGAVAASPACSPGAARSAYYNRSHYVWRFRVGSLHSSFSTLSRRAVCADEAERDLREYLPRAGPRRGAPL